MDVTIDGDQTSSTPPGGASPNQKDHKTPRQPPPVGPSRPGSSQGFGGSLPLEEESPSPTPSARQVRSGNEQLTPPTQQEASLLPFPPFHHPT